MYIEESGRVSLHTIGVSFGQVLIFDILVEFSLVSKDGLLEEEKMVQHLVGRRTLMLF